MEGLVALESAVALHLGLSRQALPKAGVAVCYISCYVALCRCSLMLYECMVAAHQAVLLYDMLYECMVAAHQAVLLYGECVWWLPTRLYSCLYVVSWVDLGRSPH